MSSSITAAEQSVAGRASALRATQILRYAVGSTIAVAIALGFDWFLSYLLPVLGLSFLATPAPRPTVKSGVTFVTIIAVACVAGLLLSRYLIPYPLVFLPFAGLLLFHLFYAKERGAPPLLITWLMISLLLIPLIALQVQGVATLVAVSMVTTAAMTVLLVWLSYGLFPDPPGTHSSDSPSAVDNAASNQTKQTSFQNAVLSTIVVLPIFVTFYMFELIGSVLILIFVALLAQQPAFAQSFKGGLVLIIANALGGLISILYYELAVMVPEFSFFLLMILLAGLVFGSLVFSGKRKAPIFAMAFSTILLILCSTTSSHGEAGSAAYTRVIQIMVAVVYIVIGFAVVNRFFKKSEA